MASTLVNEVADRYIEESPGTSREVALQAAQAYINAVGEANAQRYASGTNVGVTPSAFRAPPGPAQPAPPATTSSLGPLGAPAGTRAGTDPGTPPGPGGFTSTGPDAGPTEQEQFESRVEDFGYYLDPTDLTMSQILEQMGIDTQNPEIKAFLQASPDLIWDSEAGQLTEQGQIVAAQMAQDPRFMKPEATMYQQAMMESGFEDGFSPDTPYQAAQEPRMFQGYVPGQEASKDQTNPETGWIRYGNGVLVDPNSGGVFYEPNSKAPGSPFWQRETVQSWSEEKVAEWKKRLHEYGYLTAEQAKVKGVDQVFLGSLASYHASRYLNGGKAIANDLAGAGSEAGPNAGMRLFDLQEVQGQIRNDVREQYARVFGTEPSEGEVSTWATYVIKVGMDIQRNWRNKYDSVRPEAAAAEAEERFIEKIEQSPQAQFLRDSDEENTRMRDALERAVQVTNSLGG